MDDIRKQVVFREPFVAPRTKVKTRHRDVLVYVLIGLSAVAAAMYFFLFVA
jgi:hypothetical protein